MELTVPFILASGSPRRSRLLEQIGIPFQVQVSDVEETFARHAQPSAIVQDLALQKAEKIAERFKASLTLGADTIVVLDDTVLNKPANEDEAFEMLRALSDRTHMVFTGIALVHPDSGRKVTSHEKTRVTFAPMTDLEITNYIATGSPMDKAGSYGIQDDRGALFISGIEGDYYNVVGLPLHRLYRTLVTHFSDLFTP